MPGLLSENVFRLDETSRPPTDSNAGRPTVILQTYLDFWGFRIPEAEADDLAGIWKQLDESRLTFEDRMKFKRNGLQAGVGTPSTWPAIREILIAHDPKAWHHAVMSDGASPLSVELGELSVSTPLFYYDAENLLHGRRYPAGLKCWRIHQAVDPAEVTHLRLEIMPELRQEKRETRLPVKRVGAAATQYENQVFEDLSISLVVAPEEYVVIGPASGDFSPSLVGSVFTRSEVEGRGEVIVYCIVPKIVMRTASAVGASGVAESR